MSVTKCEQCGWTIDATLEECANCGASLPLGKGGTSAHEMNRSTGYDDSSKYGTARFVAAITEVLGWLTVIAGVILAVVLVATFAKAEFWGFNLAAVLPAGGTIISGFIMVMGAQVTRATVDTADNTRRMAQEIKRLGGA